MAAPDCSKVLWLGASPRPEHYVEHANRGLALCVVNPDNFNEGSVDFVCARGIVFCAMSPMLPAVKRTFGCIVRALNHGLYVLVLVADSVAHAFVQETIEKVLIKGPARERIRYRIAAPAHEIAAASQAELRSIAPSLEGVFAHANVRNRYIKAAADLGVARDPQDIWESFLNLPPRSWPKAPIHGDLHAENVRVRGDDAIIIDLAKVTMGPPGADPACLEVWIAFQLPPTGYEVDEAAWLRTIQEFFAYRQVVYPPDPDPTSPVGWLHDGIIRTRTVALTSCQPVDCAITLALYLLRRATFDPDVSGIKADVHRRTWAWILGCQLLEAVQKIDVQYKVAA